MCIALKKIIFRNRAFSLTLVLLLILAIVPIGAFANIGDGYDETDEIVTQIGDGENGEDGDYAAGNEQGGDTGEKQGGDTGEKQDGDAGNEQGGDNDDGDDDIIVDEIEEEIPEKSEPYRQTLEATVYAGEGLYYLSEANERIKLTGCFPEDACAVAFPVELSLDLGTVVAAYDIAVYDAEGELFEPESAVTVELELENMPELEEDSLVVVRVPSGGAYKVLNTELYVSAYGFEFEADYLSVLAVVDTIDQSAEDEEEIIVETEDENDDEIINDLIDEDEEAEEIDEIEEVEEIEAIDEDEEEEIEEVIEEVVVENEVEEEPIIEEPVVIELFEQTLTAQILESRGEQRSSADYQQPTQNATNVTITVTGRFPQGAYVIAYPVEMEIETGEDEDDVEVIAAYDITIYSESGEVIQPDHTASVSIILPELEGIDEVSIYHIADDGTEELVAEAVTVDGDEVRFEAESFSTYAIVMMNSLLVEALSTSGSSSFGVSVTVTKKWVGNDASIRPESITVSLQQNVNGTWVDVENETYGDNPATLTANNVDTDGNWIYRWDGLPEGVEYKVVEVDVLDGYEAVYSVAGISPTITLGTKYSPNDNLRITFDMNFFILIKKGNAFAIWTPLELTTDQENLMKANVSIKSEVGNGSLRFYSGYGTFDFGSGAFTVDSSAITFKNKSDWSLLWGGTYNASQIFTITNTFQGYEITIEKVDEDGEVLPGAEFELSILGANNGWAFVGDLTELMKDGTVTISGLFEGRYRLVETEAPADYQELNDAFGNEIYFTIDVNGNVTLTNKDGEEVDSYDDVDWTAETTGKAINLGTLTVTNHKNIAYVELPETGGNGLLGLTMFGFTAIFGGASALLIIQKAYSKKRRAFHKINGAGSGD